MAEILGLGVTHQPPLTAGARIKPGSLITRITRTMSFPPSRYWPLTRQAYLGI
jgi:hypothetical protein